MKKLLCAAALMLGISLQAQIAVTTGGAPITNDQTFTYSTLDANAKLSFIVTNTSAEPIYLKIRVEEITNSNGASFQLCFGGLCYFSIVEGNIYPNNALLLQPGGSNAAGDHFWNYNAGDGVSNMDFRFTFVQTTSTGTPIADLLSVNYQYQPQLGTGDFQNLQSVGVRNVNTLVGSTLSVDSAEALKMEILNLNGQVVRRENVSAAQQSFDVSSLSAGVYFARFTNNDKQSASVRIVKK